MWRSEVFWGVSRKASFFRSASHKNTWFWHSENTKVPQIPFGLGAGIAKVRQIACGSNAGDGEVKQIAFGLGARIAKV